VIGIEQVTDQPGLQFDPNLSPDGRQLLYIGLEGDDWDIFLHRVGGENPVNLTADSPADEYCPAFSPDGERIAFYSSREGGGIFVMGATGESPRRVTDAGFDPAWSPDGRRIVYSTERGNDAYGRGTTAALSVVEIKTGETRELFAGDAVDPSWSPDGKRIAFWSATGGLRDIWTIAADGGDPLAVTQDHHTDWNPLWSADGRYLYFISDRGGSPDLWRFQIDQGSGRTLGEPEAVTVGISAVWQASLSADGRRVAFATRDLSSEIVRIGFDSENERPVGDPTVVYATSKALNNIDVSPDGQWLAMATRAPREDIYVMRLDGTGRRRLTDDPDRDRGPNWSADGDWLTWYSNRGGSYEVWVVRRDGTDAHPLTETPGRDLVQPLWAPDERRLAVSFSRNQSSWTILVDVERPFAEIREPLPLVGTEIKNLVATGWSPGGRWLVGGGYGPAGEDVGVLHDLQTGESLLLQSSETAYHDWDGSAAWLDEGRFLFGDRRLGGVHVWDVAEGTSREVIGVPGPGVIRVIDDGRALIINRSRDESDIWMLRLGE
jgi:Tol biopolymer transport system component